MRLIRDTRQAKADSSFRASTSAGQQPLEKRALRKASAPLRESKIPSAYLALEWNGRNVHGGACRQPRRRVTGCDLISSISSCETLMQHLYSNVSPDHEDRGKPNSERP